MDIDLNLGIGLTFAVIRKCYLSKARFDFENDAHRTSIHTVMLDQLEGIFDDIWDKLTRMNKEKKIIFDYV